MKNIIKAGLCTILLGASPIVSGQDTPKNRLEVITEQNAFIEPDGNYSLKRNPKDYGFTLGRHVSDSHVIFDDAYYSSVGWIRIGGAEASGELQEIYDVYSFNHLKAINDDLLMRIKGMGVRSVDKDEKKIIIDSNPAIQGGAELWTYSRNVLKESYGPKCDVVLTLARGKKNIYTFTLFYYMDGTEKEAQAKAFYNDIIRSFHALK
jgi:hypothetical protein